MEPVLLVRYAEIHLKGLNRPFFERGLMKRISLALRPLPARVVREQGRVFVFGLPEDAIDEAANKLTRVFGIHSVSPALAVEKDWDAIVNAAYALVAKRIEGLEQASFKVIARRADKRFSMRSQEICRTLGGLLLEAFPVLRVDVHEPDFYVGVEIRQDQAFLFAEERLGVGGMPVGTNGHAMLLISGGIDSPVAGYMIAKRGVRISAVHFYSYPYTSERAREKVAELTHILAGFAGEVTLYLVPFTEIQLAIYEKCPQSETTVLMRRLMMQISEKIAVSCGAQALITGAFSVTKQVIQLGYLPRLNIQHTSVRDTGQIYMPLVNWGLFVAIVLAVVMFRSSSNLAAAYGIAVTLDMLITTTLTFFVIRYGWRYPLALCVAATGCFFVVDLAFFASNLLKLFQGGWFPLMIGGIVFSLMMTWKEGRRLLNDKLRADAIDLKDFLESIFISPPTRVDGTAVFLTAETGAVPNALLHNLKHNKVLHQQNLFVTVQQHEVPWIGMEKRLLLEPLGHDCWQVVLNYGFKNDPDLPKALALLAARGVKLNPMSTSYFLSRHIVTPTVGTGLMPWREKLFAYMHHTATAAAEYLNLPSNAVVELGGKVEI